MPVFNNKDGINWLSIKTTLINQLWNNQDFQKIQRAAHLGLDPLLHIHCRTLLTLKSWVKVSTEYLGGWERSAWVGEHGVPVVGENGVPDGRSFGKETVGWSAG